MMPPIQRASIPALVPATGDPHLSTPGAPTVPTTPSDSRFDAARFGKLTSTPPGVRTISVFGPNPMAPVLDASAATLFERGTEYLPPNMSPEQTRNLCNAALGREIV
ncbi:MAG: hypothetical protein HQM15_04265 [Deltaproteobacteria bacterium]|nr:hypothetical protein [Deltaproteobacteria bacterium]